MKTRQKAYPGMLAVLGLVMLLILAACAQEPRLPDGNGATTGSLSVNVAGTEDATVRVTGPGGFDETRTTPATLTNLTPGTYTITPTPLEGYTAAPAQAVVRAGEHTNVTVTYTRDPAAPTDPARGAYYRGADGQLVRIDDEDIDAGRFVFMTWLEDVDDGVDLDFIGAPGDPGMPTAEERDEVAPSYTQNLAVAYMGYRADDGNIYPVVNATVRWTFDDTWDQGFGHMDFGTTADGGNNCGFLPAPISEVEAQCIDNRQADTTTKSATIRNPARFPVTLPGAVTGADGDYPLYNVTGVNTPDTDGLSWVTLFSLDQRAAARLSVVGYVNGNEIAKRSVTKRFAPLPRLEITKTVTPDVVEPNQNVTFTVTVSNVGSGDAQGVVLQDRPGTATDVAAYNIVDFPAEEEGVVITPVGDDGFDATFDLAAGESRTFTFTATASETGVYCNVATVVAGVDEAGQPVRGLPISAEACFTVIGPELTIIKEVRVLPDGPWMQSVEVAQDQPFEYRVSLINQGDAEARGVVVTDELTTGNDDFYSITGFPEGVTAVGDSGWTFGPINVGAGETRTFTFTAVATADDTYCDVAAFTSDNAGAGQDDACVIVATPALEIEKTNAPETVTPGGNYTSTITVTNTGGAVARNVVITDRVGLGPNNTFVEFVSANWNGNTGTFDEETQTVTFAVGDIAPGESVTVTVTQRVPDGAPAGEYCNIAAFTSDNVPGDQVEDCITVPAFAARQTQMVENLDPVDVGEEFIYTSAMYVEPRSNVGVYANEFDFTFGVEDPTASGVNGIFNVDHARTTVFYLENPPRDPQTGQVSMTPGAAGAEQLTAGVDYNITTTAQGRQVIVMDQNFVIAPNSVIYVRHFVTAPAEAVPAGLESVDYNSTYTWTSTRQADNVTTSVFTSEPTTVLAPTP